MVKHISVSSDFSISRKVI